jgi:Xaa-Pro aminopeptidase
LAVADVVPKLSLMRIADACEPFRIIKTPEEIALAQRAYSYFDRIHAFARDYILEKGTRATDFAVSSAAVQYGTDLIMKDIKRDGRPHTAVGIQVGISCRTGPATAYPHPNQFFHKRIEKGDALQVSGGVRAGGYGGECYRAYQIAPLGRSPREGLEGAHGVDPPPAGALHRERRLLARGQDRPRLLGEDGDAEIYHRPAHGEGMEGHQPPYIALGDFTTLEEGMMFSNEPGLYDPEARPRSSTGPTSS